MQYNDINSDDKALEYIAEITKYMELMGNTRTEVDVYDNGKSIGTFIVDIGNSDENYAMLRLVNDVDSIVIDQSIYSVAIINCNSVRVTENANIKLIRIIGYAKHVTVDNCDSSIMISDGFMDFRIEQLDAHYTCEQVLTPQKIGVLLKYVNYNYLKRLTVHYSFNGEYIISEEFISQKIWKEIRKRAKSSILHITISKNEVRVYDTMKRVKCRIASDDVVYGLIHDDIIHTCENYIYRTFWIRLVQVEVKLWE